MYILIHPHNKEQYDLCPRENEVNIIYTELVGDEIVSKKATLSSD